MAVVIAFARPKFRGSFARSTNWSAAERAASASFSASSAGIRPVAARKRNTSTTACGKRSKLAALEAELTRGEVEQELAESDGFRDGWVTLAVPSTKVGHSVAGVGDESCPVVVVAATSAPGVERRVEEIDLRVERFLVKRGLVVLGVGAIAEEVRECGHAGQRLE